MEYKFYKQTISKTTFMEVDSDINVLNRFGDSDWTSERVQDIIEGVKSTDNTEKEYRWGNEDVIVISNKHAVFFIDLLSTRGSGKQVREKQDLDLTHEEFIKFLEDFKEFIEKEV
jgi:hypothetical protein